MFVNPTQNQSYMIVKNMRSLTLCYTWIQNKFEVYLFKFSQSKYVKEHPLYFMLFLPFYSIYNFLSISHIHRPFTNNTLFHIYFCCINKIILVKMVTNEVNKQYGGGKN